MKSSSSVGPRSEKITHFDHERIPERIVHARGSGARGYFQPYKSMAHLTGAAFQYDPKKKTPVFVRYSPVAGGAGAGSGDTSRDARGGDFPEWELSVQAFDQKAADATPTTSLRRPNRLPSTPATLFRASTSTTLSEPVTNVYIRPSFPCALLRLAQLMRFWRWVKSVRACLMIVGRSHGWSL